MKLLHWLKRDLRTVVIAVAAAAVTAGGPALAHGVHAAFAHNADKVDGKHAVAAGASLGNAAGRLVAHNGAGQVSPKFIPTQFAAPRAYAVVDRSPTEFLAGKARRGFTAVDSPSTGIYCLTVAASTGINTTKAVVVATVEWGASSGSDLLVFWQASAASCAAGQIQVRTYDFTGGLALTDDVAFSVAVL